MNKIKVDFTIVPLLFTASVYISKLKTLVVLLYLGKFFVILSLLK